MSSTDDHSSDPLSSDPLSTDPLSAEGQGADGAGAGTPVPAAGRTAPASTGREVFRKALRDVTILLAGLAVVSVVVGAVLSGAAGVWGALLGVALAAVFSGTTIVAMYRTADSTPATMAGVVMGSWLVKMLVVIVALVVLGNMDFYDRWVFAVVLLVGAIGSAFVDYRAVTTSRVPYVEPTE